MRRIGRIRPKQSLKQKIGEVVLIPAGCSHQVRNLKSCIKVALDFVSPENVWVCERLAKELRQLPSNHRANEDKLEVFITGGTDTAAGTMEWALSLLLNHPKKLHKVRAEIDTHVGNKRLITDADLPRLHHLHNVIKETLRLFPAGPLLVPHESSAECTVAGYDIPGTKMLLVNAYAIHRDPNLWEDATSFKPERFEGGGEAKGFKLISLGSGRRSCPGELMATRLMGLALGSLIQCFEWNRVGEQEVDMTERQYVFKDCLVDQFILWSTRQRVFRLLDVAGFGPGRPGPSLVDQADFRSGFT